jgi:hypothetical protein
MPSDDFSQRKDQSRSRAWYDSTRSEQDGLRTALEHRIENLSFSIRLVMFLGHGRALEVYLIGAKLLLAFLIFPTKTNLNIPVLENLRWSISDPIIASPFILIGCIQLGGLIMNYNGIEKSWIPRSTGAALAMCLWVFLITKSILVDEIFTSLMPFAIMSFFGSSYLFWRAWNGLPIPGIRTVI